MPTTLTSLANPRWENDKNTVIYCDITTSQFGSEVLPFSASSDDPEDFGRQLFADLVAGKYGSIAAYVAPEPYVSTASENKIEAERRLAATDWVNQPDVYDPANTLHLTNRDAFIAYRAQVRAIAVNPVDGNLDWPTEPKAVWSN